MQSNSKFGIVGTYLQKPVDILIPCLEESQACDLPSRITSGLPLCDMANNKTVTIFRISSLGYRRQTQIDLSHFFDSGNNLLALFVVRHEGADSLAIIGDYTYTTMLAPCQLYY